MFQLLSSFTARFRVETGGILITLLCFSPVLSSRQFDRVHMAASLLLQVQRDQCEPDTGT